MRRGGWRKSLHRLEHVTRSHLEWNGARGKKFPADAECVCFSSKCHKKHRVTGSNCWNRSRNIKVTCYDWAVFIVDRSRIHKKYCIGWFTLNQWSSVCLCRLQGMTACVELLVFETRPHFILSWARSTAHSEHETRFFSDLQVFTKQPLCDEYSPVIPEALHQTWEMLSTAIFLYMFFWLYICLSASFSAWDTFPHTTPHIFNYRNILRKIKPLARLRLHVWSLMFSLCLCGFSPDMLTSSYIPKTWTGLR